MHCYYPTTENAFIKAAVAFFHFAFLDFILLVISLNAWASFNHVLRRISAVSLLRQPGQKMVKNCSVAHQRYGSLGLKAAAVFAMHFT